MDLAWRQDEPNGIAESVNADVDFGAQAAARTPDRLIFAPPFLAPAACWCARTMVESMIRYSKSGSSTRASKIRLPNALLGPAAEALEHAVPVAKLRGQVAPRSSRAHQPQHSVHEQTIVLAVPSPVPFFTRNKRFDALPLRARQCPANQDHLPSCDLESHSRVAGNPLMSTGPSVTNGCARSRFRPPPRRDPLG